MLNRFVALNELQRPQQILTSSNRVCPRNRQSRPPISFLLAKRFLPCATPPNHVGDAISGSAVRKPYLARENPERK